MVLQPYTCLSLLLLALAGRSGGREVKSRRQSIAITPRAGEPAVDAYDLLLTDDFGGDGGGGGGGSGGGGYPSNDDGDEMLLYPTLASTTSTMPKTDTKKAFFLLGLIGAVADLDRRAFFVVVAVTNLYAMRFLKAHVRPALTKWMCCNTRFPVWKSTSRRWRWRRKLGFHTGNSSTAASPARYARSGRSRGPRSTRSGTC